MRLLQIHYRQKFSREEESLFRCCNRFWAVGCLCLPNLRRPVFIFEFFRKVDDSQEYRYPRDEICDDEGDGVLLTPHAAGIIGNGETAPAFVDAAGFDHAALHADEFTHHGEGDSQNHT